MHGRTGRETRPERMSDLSFRGMTFLFQVVDMLIPYVDRRAAGFGIREGMTVVDYGCGPGRYTAALARLVGPKGTVYAVDIHELAVEAVRRRAAVLGLENVIAVLAEGYASGLPDQVAEAVCVIDMFFAIRQPGPFLRELARIARPDGVLVIDDGHQPRRVTKSKILSSGAWQICKETRDHLECRKQCC